MGFEQTANYRCDRCSKCAPALEGGMGAAVEYSAPDGWTELDGRDMCPECSVSWKRWWGRFAGGVEVERATLTVDRLIADIGDRRGLKRAWEEIDGETAIEIREHWINLVHGTMDGAWPPSK